jgi:hypothetical protein
MATTLVQLNAANGFSRNGVPVSVDFVWMEERSRGPVRLLLFFALLFLCSETLGPRSTQRSQSLAGFG